MKTNTLKKMAGRQPTTDNTNAGVKSGIFVLAFRCQAHSSSILIIHPESFLSDL